MEMMFSAFGFDFVVVSTDFNCCILIPEVLIVCTVVPWATGQNFHEWIHRGLVILLTACPCAVVIGAPLATTCAIAATRGLLIKKAETLQTIEFVTIICGIQSPTVAYVESKKPFWRTK